MGLDFGLIYEIVVPKPWKRTSEFDAYQRVIEQAVMAEQLGYKYFWTVEHHFMSEFSHCSAPDSLYGAVAAKTEKIRIGHGVRLLPFNYNHPVRAAESAAVLDLVSKGRLEFGTGRSGTRCELEGFGIDPAKARDEWEESLRMIVKAWTEDVFSWDSERFKIPPREVIPKPLQKPHPPLWAAATSASTHELAGQLGLGLLAFTLLVPLDELKRRADGYRAAIAQGTPVGKFVNENIATFTIVHCAETTEEARKIAGDAVQWYVHQSLKNIAELGAWQHGNAGAYDYLERIMNLDLSQITFEWMDAQDMCIVGDPDHCIEVVKRYQQAGCTQMIGLFDGYRIPPDKVEKSIRMFAEEVMPAFQ